MIGLFGVGISFNANVLDPFTYNEKVRLLVSPGLRNTSLGLITIVALLMALGVQPLIGQWSDHTRSRWGRRIPFLAGGTVGLAGALALVVIANNLGLLVVGAVLASVMSNIVQVAWQPLIPDYVARLQHGAAAGTKTVLEVVGVVTGIAVTGYFLAQGILWVSPFITVCLFFVILAITVATLRKAPETLAYTPQPAPQNPFNGLMASLKHAPSGFYWWMLNRVLFWSSAISIRTFLLNYLEDVQGLDPAYAQALSSQMLIMLGLGVFLLALPAGAITDKVGRRPMLIAAGLMAAVGASLFIFLQDLTVLFAGGALIALGAGIFASASWALATDLAPTEEGALYLALANGATIVGSIGGRLGGLLIDGVNQLLGTVTVGYMVDFTITALFFLGSSLVVLKIPDKSKRGGIRD